MSEVTEQDLRSLDMKEAQEAPAPQLPAVRQERKPRLPAQRPSHYPAAIAKARMAITREMEVVAKEGMHEFHKYRYAKWEDIAEKLYPLVASHGLMIEQTENTRTLLEQNDKGSTLTIIYDMQLVDEAGNMSAPKQITGLQRLRDQKGITDDKAASKCYTQARKNFCLGEFNIRVADDVREDARQTLSKTGAAREIYSRMQQDIRDAQSEIELMSWGRQPQNQERKRSLPLDWQDHITTVFREKLAELKGEPQVIWDDETGEIIKDEESAAPAVDPAPAAHGPPGSAAGADLTESLRLSALDATLGQAAKLGAVELEAAWKKIPPSDQRILEAAKNRRHKPTAVEADATYDSKPPVSGKAFGKGTGDGL